MLVLQLDTLLEQALEQIFDSENKQIEVIDSDAKLQKDKISNIQQMIQMIDLKMKAEKKTKFV